jgi:hypothetical protein
MAKFKITYGVGGGYNDITEELIEVATLNQANEEAYQAATQVFESYGIYERELEDVEKEWDDDDYRECMERWIDYHAEEVPDDYVLED